jgi:hypothetical protein
MTQPLSVEEGQFIYQTLHGTKIGNCLQAVWASLLRLPLEEVPHFVLHDNWQEIEEAFLAKHGYVNGMYLVNTKLDSKKEWIGTEYELPEELPLSVSINGLFNATVYSPKYYPVAHAVIVDKNYNIIHDPNPSYKTITYPMANEIGKNGVIGVSVYNQA